MYDGMLALTRKKENNEASLQLQIFFKTSTITFNILSKIK